jgi:hypothetical protein
MMSIKFPIAYANAGYQAIKCPLETGMPLAERPEAARMQSALTAEQKPLSEPAKKLLVSTYH